jgi:hypothetical protein
MDPPRQEAYEGVGGCGAPELRCEGQDQEEAKAKLYAIARTRLRVDAVANCDLLRTM